MENSSIRPTANRNKTKKLNTLNTPRIAAIFKTFEFHRVSAKTSEFSEERLVLLKDAPAVNKRNYPSG